ncbi:FAD-dependent oxidoreductase [Aeromicrobium panaciterrae]|uniref:FAD-dependent oxidoreductase n=1 Tax=Aeromicrobium panaciterrae TaxID=363861 RepID=UPI0031D22DC0
MTFIITQSCCNDASCVAVCPVDCIHPAPDDPDFATAEMLYINPDECIDCGACVPACPVSAVHADSELPEHLSDYAQINADYFTWVGDIPFPAAPPPAGPKVQDQEAPLRVAVVGSGPAGWFVTEELAATRRADVEITVIDRLATPHGLVRHGVAPDHLGTKDASVMFDTIARHKSTTVRLNVEVGKDITHDDLLQHHHAVVYATGAAVGRTLGVPGEDLPGSYSAAEFVTWYNGEPDHVDLAPALDHERAVIIGNGNVALDMARLLLLSPDHLHESSDMAPYAIDGLRESAIREVVLVGRRGPEHAAFTTPELLALINNPDIDVIVDPAELTSLADIDDSERTAATYAASQKVALLRRVAETAPTGAKRLVLRFGLTPQEIVGEERATAIALARTNDPSDVETIDAGLILRATGYRSTAVDGVPFDEESGRFANDGGRVTDPESGELVARVYTTGWAKRGPSGVIGTNRTCAVETATAVVDDYYEGRLADTVGDKDAFDALLTERGVAIVDLVAWKRLDSHERAEGKAIGRPRLKISDRAEQIRIGAEQ